MRKQRAYEADQEAKRQKKHRTIQDLVDTPENCNRMIEKYQKRISKIEFKTIRVKDNCNTQFIIPKGKDESKVISRYKDSRRYK